MLQRDDGPGRPSDFETGPTGVAPWDAAEIDLARLLYCHPGTVDLVRPILNGTTAAEGPLAVLFVAVLAGASKREIVDRLLANSVPKLLTDRLVGLATDREIVHHPDRAAALAQAVAVRRLKAAACRLGAAGDFEALTDALRALERRQAGATDEENTTDPSLHWHGETTMTSTVPMLVEDILPRDGIGFVAGQFGVGKSLALMNLSAAVIARGSFMGKPVLEPGGVLWFVPEGGETVLARLAAAMTAHPQLPDGLDPKHLPFAFCSDVPPLSDPAALPVWLRRVERVRTRLRQDYGVRLALVGTDTFSTAFRPTDADKTHESESLMGRAREIAKAGDCLHLIVDHYGKHAETGIRNSSVKEASSDVILALLAQRTDGAELKDKRIELRKLRAGPAGLAIPYDIAQVSVPAGEDEDGLPVETREPVIRFHIEAAETVPPGESRATGKRLSKGVRFLQRALAKIAAEAGENLVPQSGMAEVRAARETLVKAEWMATYPADGDTPAKRKGAAQKAFKRSIEDAALAGVIFGREVQGVRWLWAL